LIKNNELHASPADLARVYADIAQQSSKLVANYLQQGGGSLPSVIDDELGIAQAFYQAWGKLLADPYRLAQGQLQAWQDYWSLWHHSMLRMMGQEVAPVAQASKGDRRFRHGDWEENFLYDYIKQSYLITAKHMHHAMVGVDGLDDQVARKVDFYTRQYIDALAPSNFVLTNPEVMRETMASGGQNLVRGLKNLLEDLTRGKGRQLKVSMTDEKAFKLGENIAVTPGKVVYQNGLMQLIQYEPATAKVHRRPLLIVPPWINKYYVLDLRTHNSFVRWAVEQGHTVFMISWVNPDAQYAEKTYEDYLNEGPLAALDAMERATGEKEFNLIGFCLGGTLVATTLGYLAAARDKRVKSATFFATLIDFKSPGELEVFIDELQVKALEKKMEERGYLEGSEMATTFNMLRANDLIWSFVVNNYLLGRDPFPFDLLYWNSDSTRMPAAMHSFYLRNMYIENRLAQPGGITLNDQPIDLRNVGIPIYFISTVEDHIAPWHATYAGARLFSGPVRFVLGGSGHIAGIINPPSANKYCLWINEKFPDDPEQWMAGATQHPGSWWTDWGKWIAGMAGERVPARIPGKGTLKIIEDAPGSYVRVRVDAPKAEAGAPSTPAAQPPGSRATRKSRPRSAKTTQ